MTLRRDLLFVLTCGAAATMMASGCITVQSDGLSLSSLTKPKIANVNPEEEVVEAPPDPKHPERLKVAYARWMEDAGMGEEARSNYDAVLAEEPKNVDAILGLARLDQLSGEKLDAEQRFKQAVELSPNYAAAQFGLGQFYAEDLRWQEALSPLRKSVELAPGETDYRYRYAVALAQTGDSDTALPHFIRTVGDAEAHYNVGTILKDQGRFEQARRHFQIAVNKKPEWQAPQDRLAEMQDSPRRPDSVKHAHANSSAQAQPAIQQLSHEQTPASRQHLSFPESLTPRQREQLANQRPLSTQ